VKKILLKLMMVLICFQTTWVQAAVMGDQVVGYSSSITAHEHIAHDHVSTTSHVHDHDCEKCVQHCHQTSMLLTQFTQTQFASDSSALSIHAKRLIATAPPSKIERPKWDATAV
jgi:hypothetical protein